MNVSLRQLKAFLGVAEAGNFTRAAQRLQLSQAALSAAIRELEAQFGTRLFERTTRNVSLTGNGKLLLETARRMVGELENVSLRMQEAERQEVSEIKLGFTPLTAAQVLPSVIERFAATQPGVSVSVFDAGPAAVQQQVEAGHLDAGYAAFFSPTSGLQLHTLLTWRLIVVSSRGQQGMRVPFQWAHLAEHRMIALQDTSPVQQLVDAQLKREKVQPAERWTVNHLETSIAMAEKGFGLAIIPSFAAAACKRYAVRLRPLGPFVGHEFSQISRAGRELPPAIARFAATLAEVIEEESADLLGVHKEGG